MIYEFKGKVSNLNSMCMMELDYLKDVTLTCPNVILAYMIYG